MLKFSRFNKFIAIGALLSIGMFASVAYASHSWGGYHWARTANPFNLKLGDNVSTAWDDHLTTASTDWSVSPVLDTTIIAGGSIADGSKSKGKCRAINGRVEVCNKTYGNNGWLGIASIWISGSHIVQGTVQVNDTYFNTPEYNTPAWKQFVMCQEIGHTFGLDHQDENFSNPNLGTCMDYTSDPTGLAGTNGILNNEHPNTHDYSQLDTIYAHLDAFTSALSSAFSKKFLAPAATNDDIDTSDAKEWGKVIRKSNDGRSSLYERDLGKGNKVFTFVIWAN